MRTEIVIPFAFDTAPLEALLQTQGEQEVMRILHEMVKDNVISKIPRETDYYGHERKNGKPDWSKFMKDAFRDWLDEHSQEIMDEAVLLLAMRAGSKRKWRDVLKELREAGDEDSELHKRNDA